MRAIVFLAVLVFAPESGLFFAGQEIGMALLFVVFLFMDALELVARIRRAR